MVTLKDVAEQAKVSVSTVSNVLNASGAVGETTKARVLETVARLGYVPNMNGRMLKSKKTHTIGFILSSFQAEFYGRLINSLFLKCSQNGYGLTVNINDGNCLYDSYHMIMGGRMDGAIVINPTITDAHIDSFISNHMPVVFLDRKITAPTISSVVFESYKSGCDAVEYLLRLGHKSIGYIHGITDQFDETERFRGVCDALKKYGIALDPRYELQGYFQEEAAYTAVRALLSRRIGYPEAFIAANDLMAVGCIKAVTDLRLSVPDDISVIGFDDISFAQYERPSLTTFNCRVESMAESAADALFRLIKTGGGELVEIPAALQVRESCLVRIGNKPPPA